MKEKKIKTQNLTSDTYIKMNNNLIICVMYYSLFHKKLTNNESEIIKYLPNNVFGIFSTIHRFRKINTFPYDIHGCIGYWDKNFNTLNKKILYDNLLRVSYDSVWTDNRYQYFTAIETDPESTLELNFMLNPIYNIDKNDGIIIQLNTKFNNKYYGIIIQTKDKLKKATYLPNVFPNISWKKMIISLKNKANITSNEFELFAYKITQIKSQFITLLTNKIFSYICIFNFSRLLIDNMKLNSEFPFMYECTNNTFVWNTKDDVRNISTISEVFKYIYFYQEIATNKEYRKIKQKILDILKNIHQYSSQSLSFLGYIYPLFNIDKSFFCKKLLETLPYAENDFEKPEIIIGLNKAGCNIKTNSLSYNLSDSIFKMNWVIQAIISNNKIPSQKLIIILENKVDDILKNKKNIETNFIAVAFEALCFAYKSLSNNLLLNKIFELLFELEQRKNCYNTLYTFLNKTSRIDITGHIMNGLFQLL
jgi:AMMECR1 domain-containing protein